MTTIVSLIGPIEYWWNTPEDPNRFTSNEAVKYRIWRIQLNDFLVREGFLVYRAHEGFKGAWDNRAQIINDAAITNSDIVLNMSPAGIPGEGTKHEARLANKLGIPVLITPPGTPLKRLGTSLSIMRHSLESRRGL